MRVHAKVPATWDAAALTFSAAAAKPSKESAVIISSSSSTSVPSPSSSTSSQTAVTRILTPFLRNRATVSFSLLEPVMRSWQHCVVTMTMVLGTAARAVPLGENSCAAAVSRAWSICVRPPRKGRASTRRKRLFLVYWSEKLTVRSVSLLYDMMLTRLKLDDIVKLLTRDLTKFFSLSKSMELMPSDVSTRMATSIG